MDGQCRSRFAAGGLWHFCIDVGGVTKFLLQVVGGFAVFVTLAGWVFFCQWLKHVGLGALAMIGLAFVALLLVRIIKGNEREQPVP